MIAATVSIFDLHSGIGTADANLELRFTLSGGYLACNLDTYLPVHGNLYVPGSFLSLQTCLDISQTAWATH